MTRPEEALAAAREAAARAGHVEAPGLDAPVAPEKPTPEQLREWALIEVDTDLVYSTRRFGEPITLVKRLLLRLLRQYTIELEAQQTRFNVAVLAYLRELEERAERRGP
jgi:hypothetical protein